MHGHVALQHAVLEGRRHVPAPPPDPSQSETHEERRRRLARERQRRHRDKLRDQHNHAADAHHPPAHAALPPPPPSPSPPHQQHPPHTPHQQQNVPSERGDERRRRLARERQRKRRRKLREEMEEMALPPRPAHALAAAQGRSVFDHAALSAPMPHAAHRAPQIHDPVGLQQAVLDGVQRSPTAPEPARRYRRSLPQALDTHALATLPQHAHPSTSHHVGVSMGMGMGMHMGLGEQQAHARITGSEPVSVDNSTAAGATGFQPPHDESPEQRKRRLARDRQRRRRMRMRALADDPGAAQNAGDGADRSDASVGRRGNIGLDHSRGGGGAGAADMSGLRRQTMGDQLTDPSSRVQPLGANPGNGGGTGQLFSTGRGGSDGLSHTLSFAQHPSTSRSLRAGMMGGEHDPGLFGGANNGHVVPHTSGVHGVPSTVPGASGLSEHHHQTMAALASHQGNAQHLVHWSNAYETESAARCAVEAAVSSIRVNLDNATPIARKFLLQQLSSRLAEEEAMSPSSVVRADTTMRM